MQFSLSTVALVASAASVVAIPHNHVHRHADTHAHKRDVKTMAANALFNTLQPLSSGNVVEGLSLPYQNQLVSNATDDAQVYFWKGENFALAITDSNPAFSAPTPDLVVNLPAGSTATVSFDSSFSGAYAAVFPDTQIGSGGQWFTSWVEVTTSGQATMDVTFLPNMQSRFTSVEMEGCLSDISACSYQCKNGLQSCVAGDDVTVANCPQADFPMSNFEFGPSPWGQTSGDVWNGGCQMQQNSMITTTFS